MDFRQPNYAAIFRERLANLDKIRAQPECLPGLREFYRENPAEFISDWGVTFDPRNAERGLPTIVPFVLFERQREWVEWVVQKWKNQQPGLTEKSRDMGISWLSMATASTLCLFNEGMAFGVGSRKEDYVDKIGTIKALLPKARMFLEYIPEEFRGGWVPWRDAPFMRINFPETGSLIMGEAGDQIGRGDRASIYLIDEAAYLERPELVEHSLSQTTNCRIDVSSVNGSNNVFAVKRHSGKVDVFVFDWRSDPRKDDDWYQKQVAELDPITVAQEIDRDYSASVAGIVIPGAWARAALDAHEKLGIAPSGVHALSFDPADEGDKNALCGVTGVEVDFLDEWSGKGADLFDSAQRVFQTADERGYTEFRYDADGLGASVRGDARIINETRKAAGRPQLVLTAFRGSDAVFAPDGLVEGIEGGRTNQDYFMNRKAQAWWSLRRRFQKTHRWVVDGVSCPPDDIISINTKKCPLWVKAVSELSQPTYGQTTSGKIVINKKPENTKSPNMADAIMMRFAQLEAPAMKITEDILSQVMRSGRRRR